MKRNTLNYIVDIPLLLQSVVVSVTGVVLMYGSHGTSFLGFDSRELLHMHEQIGILMVAFSVIHLVLHWKWMACTTKNLLTGKSSLSAKCETAQAVPVED
jgi:cytochrome b subunit of formate dehydrogenase